MWLVIASAEYHDTLIYHRILVVILVFGIVCFVNSIGLDMLVLLSYNRFGKKISEEATQIVAAQLQKELSDSSV